MNIHLLHSEPTPLRTPSPAWQRYHARTHAIHTLVDRINQSYGEDPVWTDVPGMTDLFPDESEMLRALQGHWHTILSGHILSALDYGEDLRTDVVNAYRQTARDMPGLRRYLDRYADHPAISAAVRAEHLQVAVSAGVASYDTPIHESVALGKALVEEGFNSPVRTGQPRRRFGWVRSAEA